MQSFKLAFVALAALGLILPQAAIVQGADSVALIPDLALGQGNVLAGQVVDPQGTSLKDVVVTVSRGEREVVRTVTDRDGRFAVAGLSGGAYTLSAQGSELPCRVWAPGTAPPSAKSGLLLVSGDSVARANVGQWIGQNKLVAVVGAAGLTAIVVTAVTDNPSGS